MNGQANTAILAGTPQDPAQWFLAWLREALASGGIDQTEWYQQIERIWRSICSMERDHWNASITTIRDYMTGAGLGVPDEFPRPLQDSEYLEVRANLACPVPGRLGLTGGLTQGGKLALAGGAVAVILVLGAAALAFGGYRWKPKRKPRRKRLR